MILDQIPKSVKPFQPFQWTYQQPMIEADLNEVNIDRVVKASRCLPAQQAAAHHMHIDHNISFPHKPVRVSLYNHPVEPELQAIGPSQAATKADCPHK